MWPFGYFKKKREKEEQMRRREEENAHLQKLEQERIVRERERRLEENRKKEEQRKVEIENRNSFYPFTFKSDCHQRYESNIPVQGLQQCGRTVSVINNTNGCPGYRLEAGVGYIVKIYNDDLGKPNMSDKPMKLIRKTNEMAEFRGFPIEAQTPFGWQEIDYSDYGLTIYYKNSNVCKCVLHMYDRGVDLEYRKESASTNSPASASQEKSIAEKYVEEAFTQIKMGKDGDSVYHLIKVVENEAVHTVARERPLAADREQAAPVTDDLHLISRTQVLRRPGSPLDGRFREKGRIFGRIDDTLHAPVELRSQRSRIGGDGDPQIGIAPQQVGGQQGRSPDALAMLGRHGDDKPADAPGGECLQYAVVGLVKPPELQKGIDSGGKQAERRQIPRRSRFCGGQVLQYIYIHRSVVFKLRPVARRCRREAEGFDTHGSAGFQNRRIRQSQNSVQLFERQRKNGTARCSGYRKPRTMCSEKDRRRRRSGWDVRSCGVESEEVLLKLGKGEIVGAFPRLVGCMEFPPDGNQVVDSIGVAFGQTLLRTIDYDRGDETTLFRTVVE